MRIRVLLAGLSILLSGTALRAQFTGDVLGMHNLGPGTTSPISGAMSNNCGYCHAPHSGLNTGLWNQKLTNQNYTLYTSDTERLSGNSGRQPTLGQSTNHCLSCHDGTVALGTTVVYGNITLSGKWNTSDVLGTTMQFSHPFSLVTPLKDTIDLASTLVQSHKTTDPLGAVKLKGGNVECTSCHDPHVQAKDVISQNFLVRDSSSGHLCLACHDPTRQMTNVVNPMADWDASAHAQSAAKISSQAQLGSYGTVALAACIGCHAPHNATGASQVLRAPNEADCLNCHNGSSNTSGMPLYSNLALEYTSSKHGHPFPDTTNNPHTASEATLLNNNRHATCVDCHNSHGSEIVTLFPPAPLIRISQMDIAGINASDGISVRAPAVNQYENCLRCHGTSSGKQTQPIFGYTPVRALSAGAPPNVILEFDTTAKSSHPVMHSRSSPWGQPSLLTLMWNEDGVKQVKAMGTQILCTDCHNSDDNREFGGQGPNGPHGSTWSHILERRYEFSQTGTPPSPGGTVTNLFPNPDLSVAGPYALCGKCHDLPNQIMQNTSWNEHSNHINKGFSCSACHTAHGMGATSLQISGDRLVNFDMNVVAQNDATTPVAYDHGGNTCTLTCHGYVHDTTTKAGKLRVRKAPIVIRK